MECGLPFLPSSLSDGSTVPCQSRLGVAHRLAQIAGGGIMTTNERMALDAAKGGVKCK